MSTNNQTEIRAFRKLELKKHGPLYRFCNNALKNPLQMTQSKFTTAPTAG